MKKVLLLLKALVAFSFLTSVSNAQIQATSVIGSQNVTNPENAADGDASTYAVMHADIGVLNFSELSLAFSQYGFASMNGAVQIQTNGTILNAEVLQSLTITLYDSEDKQVGEQTGDDFVHVDVGDGTSAVNLHVRANEHAKNVASIKIRLAGLAAIANSIRVYQVFLSNNGCLNVPGDIVYASHNVQNPANAVSPASDDYALLTPPLLAGNAYLDIQFSDAGEAGKFVNFTLGEGNAILNLSLLQHISISVYDTDNQLVVTKSDFTIADAEVLSNDMFKLRVETPAGNYHTGRARITFTSLLGLATTLKVYKTNHAPDENPRKPHISLKGSTQLCKGDTIKLHARPFIQSEGISYQWYRNGKAIDNATDHIFVAKKGGEYSVVLKDNNCASNPSVAVVITDIECRDDKINEFSIKAETYPNPFSAYTTVNISGIKSAAHIIVSDKAGNLIEEHQLSAAGFVRILTKAAPGIYFIKIISGNSVATKTVVKL